LHSRPDQTEDGSEEPGPGAPGLWVMAISNP